MLIKITVIEETPLKNDQNSNSIGQRSYQVRIQVEYLQ